MQLRHAWIVGALVLSGCRASDEGAAPSATASPSAPAAASSQPACAAGLVACGPDQRCTRLATDADHCGGCGKVCKNSHCITGACAPIETVATDLFGYRIGAHDETALYVVGAGAPKQYHRLPFDGGGPATRTLERGFVPQASDGTHFYGCTEVPEPKNPPENERYGACELSRVKLGGGPVTRLAKVERQSYGTLATDGERLYWAVLPKQIESNVAELQSMPIAGGDIASLAKSDGLSSLVVSRGVVYFAASPRTGEAGIYRLGKGDAGPSKLVRSHASALAVDARNLYYARAGSLFSMPLNGGSERMIARNLVDGRGMHTAINGIATSATHVYLSTLGKDVNFTTVRRIPKPPDI